MTAYPIQAFERRKDEAVEALAILRSWDRCADMRRVPGAKISLSLEAAAHFPASFWRPRPAWGMTMRKTPMRNRASLSPMNLTAPKPMTLAEFLKWEERQDLRYEFDGVAPVAMTGGTAGHATVQRNLAIALGGRLRGKPCKFYGSDLKIQVAENYIRYPDGMAV